MRETIRLNKLLGSDCGQCSSCCRTIMVEVTASDLERLTRHTNIPADRLVKLYSKAEIDSEDESDWVHLSYGKRALGLKKRRNGDCIFLKDDKSCAAYSARPMTCRIFPVCVVFDEDDDMVDLELSDVIRDRTIACRRTRGNGRSFSTFMSTAGQLKDEGLIYRKKIDQWNSHDGTGVKNDFLNFLGFKTAGNGSK